MSSLDQLQPLIAPPPIGFWPPAPGWWLLLFLIPVVNFVVAIMTYISFAQAFGKGVGFALGLLFLGVIFSLRASSNSPLPSTCAMPQVLNSVAMPFTRLETTLFFRATICAVS